MPDANWWNEEWGWYTCPETKEIVEIPKEFVDSEMKEGNETFICPCCGNRLKIADLVDFEYYCNREL